MYSGQRAAINMAVNEGLRNIIKQLANDAKLNDIPSEVLVRAILTGIVQQTDMQYFESLIVIYRSEQS